MLFVVTAGERLGRARGKQGRGRIGNKPDMHGSAHTYPLQVSLGFLELVEAKGGFADGRRHGWRPTGKTETVQNLPRRFRRMNCGDEPHDAAALVTL